MDPMEGRWVCRRCFASNEPSATTCENCGLERGADPNQPAPSGPDAVSAGAGYAGAGQPQQPQPQWTPPQPEPRTSWWQYLLRFGWVGVVVVVLAVGWYFSARRDNSGQITDGGSLQVTDLLVGDCFTLPDPDAAEVDEVDAKPCTETHEYELFHEGDVAGDEYPSDAAFDAFLTEQCIPAFNSYVGLDYEVSVLDFIYFTPTGEGWDDGDHSVQCAAFDPHDTDPNGPPDPLTSSLRNAAR